MGIAAANGNRPWETDLDPACPSCQQVRETCGHVLDCNHTGRVEALMMSIDLKGTWMTEMDTDPVLRRCILQYVQGRGSRSLHEICHGEGEPYEQMARSQDVIGW
jgi:hypothetical protein